MASFWIEGTDSCILRSFDWLHDKYLQCTSNGTLLCVPTSVPLLTSSADPLRPYRHTIIKFRHLAQVLVHELHSHYVVQRGCTSQPSDMDHGVRWSQARWCWCLSSTSPLMVQVFRWIHRHRAIYQLSMDWSDLQWVRRWVWAVRRHYILTRLQRFPDISFSLKLGFYSSQQGIMWLAANGTLANATASRRSQGTHSTLTPPSGHIQPLTFVFIPDPSQLKKYTLHIW